MTNNDNGTSVPISPTSPKQLMTEEETKEWAQYREELREFVCSPENGMMLDAERYLDPSGKTIEIKGAAFYLTSGRYRRQFISIWELFDHPDEFDRCIAMLVRRAVLIYEKERLFNTIVTCTHTARELVRHVRPMLELKLGRTIEVSEFGHYPHDSAEQLELHAFRSRHVLIFTDVMASGSLVRDMALRVARTGGNVVAVLTVVLSDDELIRGLDQHGIARTDLALDRECTQSLVPLHALTGIEVKDLREGEFEPAKLRKIDFVTVFPEAPTLKDDSEQNLLMKAKFSRDEMMVHFCETSALIHGHFASDNRSFTLGVRINKLLADPKVAGEIWAQIKDDCPRDHVLVCTFKKNDLQFTRFVQEKLEEEGIKAPFYVLKRELGDFPHLHQALYPHTHRVNGKPVVLLRATATTSEELRSIAALLAAENVKSITVICLVNRMGKYTVSFVRRVKELVTTHTGTETAEFKFIQVYHLTDLRTDDLIEMQQRVDGVLEKYIRTTEVPYFKCLAEYFRKEMAPAAADTREFDSGSNSELGRVLADVVHEMGEHRVDKLLALIRRSSKDVGASLESFQEEDVYLPVARLVIADVDYLRLANHLRRIMAELRARLVQLRAARFEEEERFHQAQGDSFDWRDFESSPTYDRIMRNLKIETRLMFALALLAHFDKNDQTEEHILEEILFANKNMSDWVSHPLNLRYHFREAGVYWLSSLMLHAVHPDFFAQAGEARRRTETASRLRARFEELLEKLPDKALGLENDPSLLKGQIRDMKNHLLAELGAHSRSLWHQRIRFLQHHVLHRNERHSPIWTALKNLETDLAMCMVDNFPTEILARLPRRSQEAFNAIITLKEIAQAAHHLAGYPSHEVSEALKLQFGNENTEGSFEQATVAPLIHWIQAHEENPPTLIEALEEYGALIFDVKEAVFDPTCPLRKALLHFRVPLESVVEDALISVNARLEKEGFGEVWSAELYRLQGRQGDPTYVLCEPHLLLEVLRNIFSNVRYAVEGPSEEPLHKKVRLEISTRAERLPEPEGGQHDYVVLVVETEGISYSSRTSDRLTDGGTVLSHQARVREFGGSLTISDGIDGKGSRAELKLISRQSYSAISST